MEAASMTAAVNAKTMTAPTGADGSVAYLRIRTKRLGPVRACFAARRAARRSLPAFVQGYMRAPSAISPLPAPSWAILSRENGADGSVVAGQRWFRTADPPNLQLAGGHRNHCPEGKTAPCLRLAPSPNLSWALLKPDLCWVRSRRCNGAFVGGESIPRSRWCACTLISVVEKPAHCH
jgi:hypothetical protein